MADKEHWVARRHARLCHALTREPRGHEGIVLGVLTEPATGDADAGVIFTYGHGFVPFCGHGVIAVATIVIERRLIVPRRAAALTLDTVAGTIRIACDLELENDGRQQVHAVSYRSAPSFVAAAGVTLALSKRNVRADIAWAGYEFLLVVDSEAAGVPLARTHLPQLRRTAVALFDSVQSAVQLRHPTDESRTGLAGVVFTGPPDREEVQLRSQAIYADGTADRSPSGTAVVAIVTVLDAMGLVFSDSIAVESLAGTMFTGRVADHVRIGEVDAVQVEIQGRAWIVADHEFVLAPDDPLAYGMPP